MHTYTVVHIAYEGDGLTALYDNDYLVTVGDYYHDKINSYIDGFFFGMGYNDIKYVREDIYISEDEYDVIYGPEIPNRLSVLKKSYKWSKTP